MLTIIFVGVIGAILVGFLLWVVAFDGMKRRGQSSQSEVNAQQMGASRKPNV